MLQPDGSVTNLQMNCLGPIVGPMEPGNRYPTEGSWSDWQACDRGWKICGIKTKVAPSLGITGISFKCCPSSKLLFESKTIKKRFWHTKQTSCNWFWSISACPVYAPFAFANGASCCSNGFSGNPILVNYTGLPIQFNDSNCNGNSFECQLPGGCANHPNASRIFFNTSFTYLLLSY